ncbi:Polyamine aminopropyltransferase (plasmid) [Asticcacaulis sp. MM231]|uniref:spermine/spermidine synthase domain-containing protein n=1 Tax=Asticcacaulis sp. MM231 TaxID=3157666 RepID=UPI0032D57ADD
MKQLALYDGPFGKVRIIERLCDGARSYSMGGGLQTLVDVTGTSLFGYVNALKLLLRDRKSVLMLGGGGGSLATMLARKGHSVTVVDIDPMAETIAKRYFDLDPSVRWFTEDGLTFPHRCGVTYDAIVVDACTGNGTVPGFTRSDWLVSVMKACTGSGVLMLNLAYNLVNEGSVAIDGFALSDEMSHLGFHSVLLRPENGWEGNELLILSRTQPTINLRTPEILDRPTEARSYLLSLRAHVKQAQV